MNNPVERRVESLDQENRMILGSILVTGGFGFIGYNLIRQIRRRYHCEKMLILDEKTSPAFADDLSLITDGSVEIIQASVLNPAAFDIGFEPDYIVHTAGILGISNVAENSVSTLDVNILGTRNCLEYASRLKNLNKFVTFSSSEVYGKCASESREADDAVIPTTGRRWCYAASKLSAEQYTMAYGRERNVPYVIIRPFNVYGPHRSGSNAISAFIENALNGKDLIISGDGSQRRSWCYVDDFVHGLLQATTIGSCTQDVFNLGNPDCGCSILELAELVVRLTKSRSRVVVTNSRDEDVTERRPNIDKAAEILGYAPEVCLEDGVRRTIEWIKSSAPSA